MLDSYFNNLIKYLKNDHISYNIVWLNILDVNGMKKNKLNMGEIKILR